MNNQLKIISVSLKIADSGNTKLMDELTELVELNKSLSLLDLRRRPNAGYTILKYAGDPEIVFNCLLNITERLFNKDDISSYKNNSQLSGVLSDVVFMPIRNLDLSDCEQWVNNLSGKFMSDYEIPVVLFGEGKRGSSDNNEKIYKIHSLSPGEIKEEMQLGNLQSDNEETHFNSKYGLTLVGIRKYVVTFLIYMDTESFDVAQEIADEIGDKGGIIYDAEGTPKKDSSGEIVRDSGLHQSVETLPFSVKESKITQIFCKLKDYENPTLVQLFESAQKVSENYMVKVIGSNILGCIPLDALRKAINNLPESKNILKLPFYKQLGNLTEYLQLNEFGEFTPEWQIIDFRFIKPES